MRSLAFVMLASAIIYAKPTIDTQIKNATTEINTYDKTQKELNQKMSETANAILSQKKEIESAQAHLKKLQEELEEKSQHYEIGKTQLNELKDAQQNLQTKTAQIEKELRSAISQSVSLSIVLEQKYSISEDSLIENEVLSLMLKQSKQKIKDLQGVYQDSSKDIANLKEQVKLLENNISNIETKKKDVVSTQQKNKELLDKLELAKESYKKELESILQKQDLLKKTLSELNIIKIDEQKKTEEKKQREEALKAKDIATPNENLPDVKKQGSSYQEVKTILYKGKKSIPPFEPYKITKKYGAYTDPLYDIKVFNESITLKSQNNDEKVRVVFNGKVIYADKTAVLNNIVIVEHDDGLHTIYANLSQIAPDVKKGVKIKQGSVIGRIDDELIFEATQKTFHINPATLFE